MTLRHELYLLHFGWLLERYGRLTVRIPVAGYLIRSAGGRAYLVDVGNPVSLIGADDCRPWYPARCEIRPEDDPVARLAELGLRPDEVDAILLSHLDFDHCGRLDAFAPLGTEVWIQRRHRVAALATPEDYDPALWNLAGLRFHDLDGDTEVEPGLRLLATDGHAVGHQSVFVETTHGPVILTIDAADNERMMRRRRLPSYWHDHEAANRSCDRLLKLQRETGAFMIYGHDAEQWPRLPEGPQPFAPPE